MSLVTHGLLLGKQCLSVVHSPLLFCSELFASPRHPLLVLSLRISSEQSEIMSPCCASCCLSRRSTRNMLLQAIRLCINICCRIEELSQTLFFCICQNRYKLGLRQKHTGEGKKKSPYVGFFVTPFFLCHTSLNLLPVVITIVTFVLGRWCSHWIHVTYTHQHNTIRCD